MKMGEFQESDVLWPEETKLKCANSDVPPSSHLLGGSVKASRNLEVASDPISIPPAVVGRPWKLEFVDDHREIDIDDCSGNGKGFIPPHIILSRRCREKMASSVFTGNGRTLKGRDLSRVRNSVLRLTGFLEG